MFDFSTKGKYLVNFVKFFISKHFTCLLFCKYVFFGPI